MSSKFKRLPQSPDALTQLRRLWLAALGAATLAQRQGRSLFAALVAEGQRIRAEQERLADAFATRVNEELAARRTAMLERIAETSERLGRMVEDLSSSLIERLGIPSRREVRELSARIAELRGRLAELAR